jgi:hypothetical protein
MLDCSVECAKVAGRTLDVMLRYTCMCSIGIQLQNYCRMVVPCLYVCRVYSLAESEQIREDVFGLWLWIQEFMIL